MNNYGQNLWSKAKKIIPGGNQLLSKRPERFLPEFWPTYYSKAKGAQVWDLENRKYFDFAQMGVGSCVLGYADKDVDSAVISSIRKGSMSSLNCYEEIDLAEELINLHPWSEMCRFSRSGGEACAIAIRIARAFTKKSKIIFCGYHGWQDWYIASNLGNNKNLDGQLLPGLTPNGVPRELIGTSLPFEYNNIEQFKDIVHKNKDDVAAIIMEPLRSTMPKNNFLHEIKNIANEIKAPLIFDEITSGFRMNCGGVHLNLGVEPDIAIFGKALGNGYPISAILGKKNIMDVAQDSFISSTFWTERVGFTAALATIKKFKNKKVNEKLIEYGKNINEGWTNLSKKYNIPIKISGIPPLTNIKFDHKEALTLQTLYAKYMLKENFLLGSSVYTTYSYSNKLIKKFLTASDHSFKKIKIQIENDNIKDVFKGSKIDMGFKRLT